jgi:hypothetical protein
METRVMPNFSISLATSGLKAEANSSWFSDDISHSLFILHVGLLVGSRRSGSHLVGGLPRIVKAALMRLSYAIHQQSKLDSRSTSRVNIATNEAGRLLSYHCRDDGGLDLEADPE